MSTDCPPFRYRDYLAPKFWPSLAAIGVLRLLAFLPMPLLSVLGMGVGSVSYVLSLSRRNIALSNIQACLPELSEREQKLVNFRHYQKVGQAILTAPINWFAGERRFKRMTRVHNREHYDAALAEGKNIILLAPHFIAIEASGLVLQAERPMIGMYQYMKNPLFNQLAIHQRQRFCQGGVMFERKDPLRAILRELNKGYPMQYSPDQDAGRKGVFVPFFHPLASTTPALGKFAQVTQAVVIPLASTYRPWGLGFDVQMGAPLIGFPKGDDIADTTQMNEAIADLIRQYPEQYLWVHKRFKTRPEGEPSFY